MKEIVAESGLGDWRRYRDLQPTSCPLCGSDFILPEFDGTNDWSCAGCERRFTPEDRPAGGQP